MKKIIAAILLVLSACAMTGAVQTYDLQSEIDAACNGCTVVVPCGVIDIGDVVIGSDDVWQKVVTIQGCGHGHLGQSPAQGSGQWDYLINGGYHYGTVLRGTISVVKGTFPGATTPKVYFRDFAMIGYGEGIGIDYGDGVNMFGEGGMENVSVGNYDIGIRLRRSYYMDLRDISMAGVGAGLSVIDSNAISVSRLDVMQCGIGLYNTGNGNSFVGGSVQTCETGASLGGFAATMSGYYFEDTDAALLLPGRGHTITGNFYASNAGAITISGHNNIVFTSETVTPVVLTGNYNRVMLSAYGSCSDSGFANVCDRLWP